MKKMSSIKVPENDDDPQVFPGTDEGCRSCQTFEDACAQDPMKEAVIEYCFDRFSLCFSFYKIYLLKLPLA